MKVFFGDDSDFTEPEKMCADFLYVEIVHANFFLKHVGDVHHEHYEALGRVDGLMTTVLHYMQKRGVQFIDNEAIADRWEEIVARSGDKEFDPLRAMGEFIRWLRTQTTSRN